MSVDGNVSGYEARVGPLAPPHVIPALSFRFFCVCPYHKNGPVVLDTEEIYIVACVLP